MEKEGCPPRTIRTQKGCVSVPNGWWPVKNGEIIRKMGIDPDGCTIDIKTLTKKDGTTEPQVIRRCPNTSHILRTLGTHTDFESGLHTALQWIKKQKNTEMG